MGMSGLISIALGGALGALSRYGVSIYANRWAMQWGWNFPLGTFTANILGSFLFGFLMGLILKISAPNDSLKLFVFTGFLGAFTTFSTFSFETVSLIQTGHWSTALLSILANVVGCLLALFAAMKLVALLG